MNGGGVQGLLEDDGGAGGAGDDDMDTDDERMIEEEFKAIYDADAKLREVLGGAAAMSQLNAKDKYQILVAYKKGGGVQGLIDDEEEEEGAGEGGEGSVIEYNGKKFKRVQIEGEN